MQHVHLKTNQTYDAVAWDGSAESYEEIAKFGNAPNDLHFNDERNPVVHGPGGEYAAPVGTVLVKAAGMILVYTKTAFDTLFEPVADDEAEDAFSAPVEHDEESEPAAGNPVGYTHDESKDTLDGVELQAENTTRDNRADT